MAARAFPAGALSQGRRTPSAPVPAPPAPAFPALPARNSRKSRPCRRRHSRGEARAARDLGRRSRAERPPHRVRGPGRREEPGPGTAGGWAGPGEGAGATAGGGGGGGGAGGIRAAGVEKRWRCLGSLQKWGEREGPMGVAGRGRGAPGFQREDAGWRVRYTRDGEIEMPDAQGKAGEGVGKGSSGKGLQRAW